MTSPAATAVANPVVEARLSVIAENSAPTKSVCAVSPGEAGFSWSRASRTEDSRVGVCGNGTEGSRIGVCGDGTEGSRVGVCGEFTEGSRVGVCGASWSRAGAKSGVGEARPPGVAKYRAATESELTESSGEFHDVAKSMGEDGIEVRRVVWRASHKWRYPFPSSVGAV